MSLENRRSLGDTDLSVTANVGAANVSSNSAVIDLKQAYAASENYAVEISSPALPNLASAQTLTYTLQESAEESANFAAVAGLGTYTVTGVNSDGAAASTFQWKLPPATKRYLRASSNGNAATSTAAQWTLSLKF